MAFETWYTSTLALPVGASDTTITVAVAPTATSGRMKIGRGTLRERISYSGVSGTTLTWVVRGLSRTAIPATAGVGQTWLAGTTIKLVLMHDQIIDQTNGMITGNLNVTGNITAGGNITTEILTVNDIINLPRYVDNTARDLAIPSPTDSMFITVGGDLQHYNGTTMQREVADTGTPTPNLSETVTGKGRRATSSQFSQGIDLDTSNNPLLPKPSQIQSTVSTINTSISATNSFTESVFMLGESAVPSSSMFVEDMVTLAAATNVQNIGDVIANTRVSFPALWSGVASNSIALAIKKFVSPSVNLWFRLETDMNGNPSGTLFDPAAIITYDSAKLTTSLATQYATVTDADNITFTSTDASVNARGYRIQAVINTNINTVTKSATCTATRCIIKTDAGVTITTATFSSNTATFSNIPIVAGTFYRIELDDTGGGSITHHRLLAATFPQNRTSINYISGSENGSSAGASGTTAWNIDSIATAENFPTFASNVTVPLGQKVHLVYFAGTYGTETINATNYFGIGYASVNTTTRGYKSYNGTVWWGTVNGADVADTNGTVYNDVTSTQTAYGYKITANSDIYIKSITKSGTCTATRGMIKALTGNTILTSATFVADTATFSTPYFLAQGATLRIEADSNGSTYNRHANTGTFVGYTGTNISISSGGGSVNGNDILYISNMLSVTTATVTFPSTNMIYMSSSLFTSLLLSKTDADFWYKMPNYGKVRLIKTTSNVWSIPVVVYFGDYNGFTGMTPDMDMFVSNTPWLLSALPGTNRFYVGRSVSATMLNIGSRLLSWIDMVDNTVYTAYQNWFVIAMVTYLNNAGSAYTIDWYADTINGATTIVASQNFNAISLTTGNKLSIMFPVIRWQLFKVVKWANVTLSIAKFFTTNI